MHYIRNYAFFWIGLDVKIPQFLVNSIKHSYNDDVNIYFLTDKKTPDINGVTHTIRKKLSDNIMIARLESYGNLNINKQLMFLDADSLVLRKFEGLTTDEPLILFRRKKEGHIINHKYPELYPEFENKTFDLMMPFLFGAIISNKNESSNIFYELLEIAKNLPERFHRWYGDQYALKIAVDKKLFKFIEYEFTDFIDIVRYENDLKRIDKPIITFKGPKSKLLIEIIYKYLTNSANQSKKSN